MSNRRFYEYLDMLRTNYTSTTRIEWLAHDGAVLFEITDDVIQDGSITVTNQNGMRRTANITVDNWANLYDVHPNKMWIGQQLRISQGLYLRDGTPFYLPQGIFYISDPSIIYNPSERKASLPLVDKWGFLDGTLGGNLDGIYILNVGDNLFVAIQQTLSADRGNGYPVDPLPPVLSSYYKGKTVSINGIDYPILECPYTYRTDSGKTRADLLLEANSMLIGTIGYDVTGRLNLLPANTDILDSNREIAWAYSTAEPELLGLTSAPKISQVYNDVLVTGGTLDGHTATGRAQNTDIRSATCIQRIGSQLMPPIKKDKYWSDEQCVELSKCELQKSQILYSNVELRSIPMYHIRENSLVTIARPERNEEPQPYLVTGFTNPIGQIGEMVCDVVNVNSLISF